MRRPVVSRYTRDNFSDWSYPVQCCVWSASVLGPCMMVLGVVLLGVAVRDPSAATVKAYNHAVGAWTQAGGGFQLFKEAFDGPSLPMILSGVSSNGSTAVSTASFDLYSEMGDALLTHEGQGYDTYDQTLFYAGVLPIGNTVGDESSWAVATAYEPEQPVTFSSFSCGSIVVTEPCSAIPPPPPPAPPPAPHFKTSAAAGAFYVANVTAMNPDEIRAVAVGGNGGGSDASARKLLQSAPSATSAGAMCTVYYRQMSFLSMLTLVATPPSSCGGGYCENTTWAYSESPSCGTVYEDVKLPIDAATYAADALTNSAWCSAWPTLFTAPRAGITLRSVSDPYVEAGALTNCSYAFKSAGEAYANAGFFFIIPGMAVSLVAFFCLEGMCSPRSFVGAFAGASGGSAAGGAAAVAQRAAVLSKEAAAQRPEAAPLGSYSAPNYGAINNADVELRQPAVSRYM